MDDQPGNFNGFDDLNVPGFFNMNDFFQKSKPKDIIINLVISLEDVYFGKIIIKEIENEKIKIYENTNKKILEGERVNQKMALEFRKQSFEEVKRLINLEADEKQKQLLYREFKILT